jgi:hypothetical protein
MFAPRAHTTLAIRAAIFHQVHAHFELVIASAPPQMIPITAALWVFVPIWGSIGPAVWPPMLDMWWCAHVTVSSQRCPWTYSHVAISKSQLLQCPGCHLLSPKWRRRELFFSPLATIEVPVFHYLADFHTQVVTLQNCWCRCIWEITLKLYMSRIGIQIWPDARNVAWKVLLAV